MEMVIALLPIFFYSNFLLVTITHLYTLNLVQLSVIKLVSEYITMRYSSTTNIKFFNRASGFSIQHEHNIDVKFTASVAQNIAAVDITAL